MKTISSIAAKAHLNAVLAEVERTGVPVTISKHGRPVVVMSPVSTRPRTFGQLPGLVVPDNFDDALPPDELAARETASAAGMTGILLDTDVLLWLVSAPERIVASARQRIGDQANAVFVSAASAWEVAMKTRLGRLDGAAPLSGWDHILEETNGTDLAIDPADAAMAGQLNWDHRDPFDRMIVAHAARRSLTIASGDKALHDGALTSVIYARRRRR